MTYSTLSDAQRDQICAHYAGISTLAADPMHAAAIAAHAVLDRPGASQREVENNFSIALTVLVFRGRITLAFDPDTVDQRTQLATATQRGDLL